MTLLDYFLPSAGQIINLFAVLSILAVFAVLGGAVSGKGRFAAADVFVGWGVVTGVFVLGGVLGPVPFTWMACAPLPCPEGKVRLCPGFATSLGTPLR